MYSLTSLHSCTTDKIELRVVAMYSYTLFSLYSCTVVHNIVTITFYCIIVPAIIS